MSRYLPGRLGGRFGFPRPRGDEPEYAYKVAKALMFSPPTRG